MPGPVPPDGTLAAYRALFGVLPPAAPEALRGRYDALALGRPWYRALFRLLLALGGLRGWAGKEFAANGTAVNLCRRRGRLVPRSRLEVTGRAASSVDGRPALHLRYRDRSLLRLVHDELRRGRDGTLLGVTYLALGPLRRVALPFAIAPAAGAARTPRAGANGATRDR